MKRFFCYVLTSHTSRSTREDYLVVFESHDPADCAARPSLDSRGFVPRICRVDFDLIVGISSDPGQGSFVDRHPQPVSTVLRPCPLHSFPLASFWTRCFRGLFRDSSFEFPSFASTAKVPSLKAFVVQPPP